MDPTIMIVISYREIRGNSDVRIVTRIDSDMTLKFDIQISHVASCLLRMRRDQATIDDTDRKKHIVMSSHVSASRIFYHYLSFFFDNEVSHDRRDSEKFFDNFHDQDLNHVYDAVSIGRRQVVEDVEEEIHFLTTHNLIFYIFDRDV